MASRQPDAQRQPARLCYYQSTYLHLQHGEHQRRHDKRWYSPATTPQEAERDRHPANAHPLRGRGEEVFEVEE